MHLDFWTLFFAINPTIAGLLSHPVLVRLLRGAVRVGDVKRYAVNGRLNLPVRCLIPRHYGVVADRQTVGAVYLVGDLRYRDIHRKGLFLLRSHLWLRCCLYTHV
ncbi:hypothetical protein D3C81_2035920 [compost metagenome]